MPPPHHFVPFPPCSLHSRHVSFPQGFGKALLSLITGPWRVVASVCMLSTPFLFLSQCLLLPPTQLQSHLLGGRPGDRESLSQLLSKSAPLFMSSTGSPRSFPALLSACNCSWSAAGPGLIPHKDGSALRAGTVGFCASLTSQHQAANKVCCTHEAGCGDVLVSPLCAPLPPQCHVLNIL